MRSGNPSKLWALWARDWDKDKPDAPMSEATHKQVITVELTEQALIDGPTAGVPRQAIAYRHLILTPYTIASLPRAAGSGAIKKAVEKAGVNEKWEASGWAKKLAARQSRKVRFCSASSGACSGGRWRDGRQ